MATFDINNNPGGNDGTPRAVKKDSTPGKGAIDLNWGKLRRTREVLNNQGHIQDMTFDKRINVPNKSNFTKKEQAEFASDRHYIETGERIAPEKFMAEKHSAEESESDLQIAPLDLTAGMTAEEKAEHEYFNPKPKVEPQKVEQSKPKEPTSADLAFEKAKRIILGSQKKEISSELKARMIQLGYIRE